MTNHVMHSPPSESQNDEHFVTEHLMVDLRDRSMRGGAATMAAQGIKFVLQLASTMVLARILTPSDFGLVAMVTALTGLVAMFNDAGLSMATVQREHITHAQVSALFWINVVLSLLVMLCVMVISPVIVWFYSEPKLLPITITLASTFIFGGLTVQHLALLRRQMKFSALATIDVVSMLVGISTAIVMALYGFGYWALVATTATSSAANCLLVWTVSTWRPSRPRGAVGIKPMLIFGGEFTASNFLTYLRRNGDNVLLGAIWGAIELGLYSKAYQLIVLPISQINAPLSAVATPVLCRLQGNASAYRRYYQKLVEAMALAGFPLVAFTILKADGVVVAVLGSQWGEVVPIFRALGPAGIVGVLNIAGGIVFVSTGRTDKMLRSSIVSSIVVVLGFLAGLPYGAVGIAIGFSTTYAISWLGTVVYAFQGSPLRTIDLANALWRPATAVVGACIVGSLMDRHIYDSTFSATFELIRSVPTLVIAYGAILVMLPGGAAFLAGMTKLFFWRRSH